MVNGRKVREARMHIRNRSMIARSPMAARAQGARVGARSANSTGQRGAVVLQDTLLPILAPMRKPDRAELERAVTGCAGRPRLQVLRAPLSRAKDH
jgi:hypothetical protein